MDKNFIDLLGTVVYQLLKPDGVGTTPLVWQSSMNFVILSAVPNKNITKVPTPCDGQIQGKHISVPKDLKFNTSLDKCFIMGSHAMCMKDPSIACSKCRCSGRNEATSDLSFTITG